MAACRDRSSPAARAADRRGCHGGAAARRCDHVADARGSAGRRCSSADARPSRLRARRRLAARRAPVSPPPVSATQLHAARVAALRFLVSYLQFAYGRGSAGAVKAATAGLRSQLITQRASGHAGRARPAPAGRVAGHGRNDPRVRRRDRHDRGRRDRRVSAAVHASGTHRPLAREQRAGGVIGGGGRDPPARRPGAGGRGSHVSAGARRGRRAADGRARRHVRRERRRRRSFGAGDPRHPGEPSCGSTSR